MRGCLVWTHVQKKPVNNYNLVEKDFKTFIKNSTSKPRKTNRSPKVSSEINWKLLQFAEDYRPPYYGTTQPLFKLNRVANPFLKSAKLDYENDSELEWEEDEAGEELVSENEESEEEQDEDEKDVNYAKKGWLVPHGYLSDDEGSEQGEKNVPTSPRKKKLEVLVPILIDIKSKNASDYEKLNPLKVVYLFGSLD